MLTSRARQTDPQRLSRYLAAHGLEPRTSSVSYIFDCPKCGKKDKLYMRQRDGRFVCWYCAGLNGFRGRAEYALAELLNLPVDVVSSELYDDVTPGVLHISIQLGDPDPVSGLDEQYDIPGLEWPAEYLPIAHALSHRGAAYLEGRGVSVTIATEYDVRYIVKERRVVFPVKVDGRLVGWQKRLIVPDRYWNDESGAYVTAPKILSSQGIPRDQTLMYLDRLQGVQHAVLCEGPVDALKAHLCGGNIASMGKYVSRGQVALLRNHGVKKLYLALDPDASQEVMRLAREYADLDCYLMRAPTPYKDLGEMPMEEVLALFDRAPKILPGFILFAGK